MKQVKFKNMKLVKAIAIIPLSYSLINGVNAQGIQYQQNPNNVNTIPSSPPSDVNQNSSYYMSNPNQSYYNAPTTNMNSNQSVGQPIQNEQMMNNQNQDYNEHGQKVIRTSETRKLDASQIPQNNPNVVDYSKMSSAQKLWGVPNSKIRQMKSIHENKMAAINQPIKPSKCDKPKTIKVGNISNELPLIRLDTSNLPTIMMVDALGNPWPIDYIVNKSTLGIPLDSENPHVSSFTINNNNPYNQGTFTVKLQDYDMPLVFSFISNQKATDCLVIAQLDKAGPNTKTETTGYSVSAMDSSLNSTLYGVAPKNSKQLKTSDASATAWLLENGDVVIRTKYDLMSPAFTGFTRNPDGTKVYRVPNAANVSQYRYRYNDVIGKFEVLR